MKKCSLMLCTALMALTTITTTTAYKIPKYDPTDSESTPRPTSAPLMGIHVSGSTPYEIGTKIGTSVKDELAELLKVDTTLDDYLIPWLEANPAIYDDYYALNSETFPDQFDELQGFADATGMNLTHLILLMLRPEIQGLLAEHSEAKFDYLERTENCFDVITHRSDGSIVIGHNEDWATEYGPFGYLIYVAQSHSPAATAQEIATYSYPASSLGFTFGWNSDGLVVSCNGITPVHPNAGGYGRYFINRYVLEARSLGEAVRRLETLAGNASYGFGVTLSDSRDVVHVEIGPKRFSKVVVKSGEAFVHTNRFSHQSMLDIEQTIGPSTTSRYARGMEFLEKEGITSAKDVRDLLGDTKNASYPMYRTGTSPDTGATLVTAVFEMESRRVTIYNTNPKDTEPLMVIPIYGAKEKEEGKKNLYKVLFWPIVAVAVVAVVLAIVGFVLYCKKSNKYGRPFRDPLL